jgi:hypothetical protein
MQSLLQVQWLVKPLKTPRPWLSCARCGTKRAFVCSEKFRVNAQKRRMDAWLIYRCGHCDQTWNLPVVERCPVQAIAPALLHSLMGNERALVQRYAFDLALLRGYAQQIESFADLSVEKSMKTAPSTHPEGAEIEFLVPFECGCRLDKLLAGELVVSRSAVARFIAMKAVTVTPVSLRAWNQTVRHGQRVTVNLKTLPNGEDLLRRVTGDEAVIGLIGNLT